MFSYDPDDDTLITSCSFGGTDIDEIDPENIFKVESKWKDQSLLYSTVQAYAAATGWKPSLSIYIRCLCYNRPTRNQSEKKNKSLLHWLQASTSDAKVKKWCMICTKY